MAESTDPEVPGFTDILGKKPFGGRIQENVTRYETHFEQQEDSEQQQKKRIESSKEIANSFYDLATDFYEYGYGRSFHFAPVFDGQTLAECIAEYQKAVSRTIQAKPGMKILDVGCGVGGPQREIVRFSGAHVVGLNLQEFQLKRARLHTEREGLQESCSYIQSDFCNMVDIEDDTYDGAYAFEATCHAPDLVDVYSEVYRVLKPGAYFVDLAWAMMDGYDPQNPEHEHIKSEILVGNGLADLRTEQEFVKAMRKAGFEVTEFKNIHRDGDLPWYTFLEGKGWCSLQSFRVSTIGRWTTHAVLSVLQCVGLVPQGSTQVHSLLIKAARGLIAGGKKEIFTPMFRLVGRKPLDS